MKIFLVILLTFPLMAHAENKFARLSKFFETGYKTQIEHYKRESVWAGKCVSKRRPEKFFPGVLEIHVPHDPILGDSLVYRPVLFPDAEAADSALNKNKKDAAKDFKESKKELTVYSVPKQQDKEITFEKYRDTEHRHVLESYRMRVSWNVNKVIFLVLEVNSRNDYRQTKYCYFTKDLFGNYSFERAKK